MEAPRRPPVYLLTGLILGLALGVLYGWVLKPAETIDAQPQDLRADFKDDYRELIARAYVSNSDLGRAEARLALLGDNDPARALAVQAQLALGEEGNTDAARALGFLAAHLEGDTAGTPIVALASPSGSSPTATLPEGTPQPTGTLQDTLEVTATATLDSTTPAPTTANITGTPPTTTPLPSSTPTPTATEGPPFVLLDVPLVCDPNIDPPLIQVYVYDAAGNPVPGVAIIVTWEGNTNRFVTGLKPEYGLGYADFTMDPAKTYTLRLEDGGEPVTNITGRQCEDQDEPYWGTQRLNFAQP